MSTATPIVPSPRDSSQYGQAIEDICNELTPEQIFDTDPTLRAVRRAKVLAGRSGVPLSTVMADVWEEGPNVVRRNQEDHDLQYGHLGQYPEDHQEFPDPD